MAGLPNPNLERPELIYFLIKLVKNRNNLNCQKLYK